MKPRPIITESEEEKEVETGESASSAEGRIKWQEQDGQAKAAIMFFVFADDLTSATDIASAQAW